MNLVQHLERQLLENPILPAGKPLVLAVSGGQDSMVLLELAARMPSEFRGELHVAHFNHQMRGRASDADERLVRDRCRVLGIPFHSARWSANEMADAIKRHGVEMAARRARMAFLAATAKSVGSRNVLLGHHADDQVELFFLRLVRGAGSLGLGGMNRVSRLPGSRTISLVRPLLSVRRRELQEWAEAEKVRHRNDASNNDTRFLRNQIRLQTLPSLEKAFGKDLPDRINRTMTLLRDEADCLREQARAFLRGRKMFHPLPIAVQRWVIVLQLESTGIGQEFDLVEELRRNTGRVVGFPGNRRFSRNAKGRLVEHQPLSLVQRDESLRIDLSAAGSAPFGGLVFEWSIRRGKAAPAFREGRELFDADRVGSAATLRHWRAGDRFQPIGMKDPVKLQNLFVNAGIPAGERRQLVIAESGGGDIFWTQRLRMSDPFKISPVTRRFLVWKWRPAN